MLVNVQKVFLFHIFVIIRCSAYLDEEITDDLLAEKIWSKANEFNTIMNHTTQLQTLPTENQENKSNIFSQFN